MFALTRPFAGLYQTAIGQEHPRYITLLQWAAPPDVIFEVLDQIDATLDRMPLDEADGQFSRMLDGLNWRPHLIAAVAIALGPRSPRIVEAIWESIDSGSWVAPQLAAIASLIDPEFVAHAQQRILAGCEIDQKRVLQLAPHIAKAMPGELEGRAGKALNAVIHLYREHGGDEDAIAKKLATPEIVDLRRYDFHEGHVVAGRWLRRLRELCAASNRADRLNRPTGE